MAQHQHPILTDRSVHMMMVVLCLFHNDDHDESVRRVHEVSFMLFLFWFWTIVMGWDFWGNYFSVRLLFEGDTSHVEELFEGEPWRSGIQQRQDTQVQQEKHAIAGPLIAIIEKKQFPGSIIPFQVCEWLAGNYEVEKPDHRGGEDQRQPRWTGGGKEEENWVFRFINGLKFHITKENKVTTRWEGPQSLSYHKYSLSKEGLLYTVSCVNKFV